MLYTLMKADETSLKHIEEEKRVRLTNELFIIFSLGSQFDHLIKQEMEKLGVFALMADPKSVTAADIHKIKPQGIVLSGGPSSFDTRELKFDRTIFDIGIPVLGICLGFHLWADHIGATVTKAHKQELGIYTLLKNNKSPLFKGLSGEFKVLESHGDRIEESALIDVIASTEDAPVAAGSRRHLYGVQFHPETTHTENGIRIFQNFCFGICRAKDVYPAERIAEQKIIKLRQDLSGKKAILALSGGSDSSTVAYLAEKAIKGRPGQIRAVYIEGVDRPEDKAHVLKYFDNKEWLELVFVDTTDEFLLALKGKLTANEKREAMRGVYKDVLEKQIKEFSAACIIQGTLYTDISESGEGYDIGVPKAKIKQHHNVGLKFSVPEILPLEDCVKDNGRNIGRIIGVPEDLLTRHPFPGPGMLIRIDGEITSEKLKIAREVDQVWMEELHKHKLYDTVWQAGIFVSNIRVTCTKGDDAVSGRHIVLWAVWSVNGFTAEAAELPWGFLQIVDKRISNEIREVGSTSYRLSGKPPSTIELG